MPEPRKKAVVRHPIGTNGSALNLLYVVFGCVCIFVILYVMSQDTLHDIIT